MRHLIIDLETENNQAKKDDVLKFLEEMSVEYHTSERQSLEEYNREIDEAEAEIERGEFITAEDLKKKPAHGNLEQNGESSITDSLQLYRKRFSSNEQKTKKVY
jgi:hypothetical protein